MQSIDLVSNPPKFTEHPHVLHQPLNSNPFNITDWKGRKTDLSHKNNSFLDAKKTLYIKFKLIHFIIKFISKIGLDGWHLFDIFEYNIKSLRFPSLSHHITSHTVSIQYNLNLSSACNYYLSFSLHKYNFVLSWILPLRTYMLISDNVIDTIKIILYVSWGTLAVIVEMWCKVNFVKN